MSRRRRFIAVLGLAALPSGADAHLVNTRLGDFYDGVLHPLLGFDFVLPWIAFAIFAAFQGKERGRWLFAVFPLGLLSGSVLSQFAPSLELLPILNVSVFAVVGLLLALALVLPLRFFVALAALVAVLHGYENGLEMVSVGDKVLFTAGLVSVGYVFVALVSAAAFAFLDGPGGWRPIALRAGGSWIAAVGIMVLGFELLHSAIKLPT